MSTYMSNRTALKVEFIKESRDYSLGKLTEWVHYQAKDCPVMKMEANAFYATFAKIK